MNRKRRPLDRESKPLRDARLVVIASEDTFAVRQYFDFFESTRIQFKVLETSAGRSAPEHLMDRLDSYRREFDIGEGDSFWLVCDCDHWVESNHITNLITVLRECRKKNINVALSNPCFELWLLLHFAEFPQEDQLDCEEVAKRLRRHASGYDKTKVYNLRINDENVLAAVQRASSKHPTLEEVPKRPQTAVHLIIQSLVSTGVISVGRASAVVGTPAGTTKPKRPRRKRK